jgi:hypothetical protein
MSISAVWWIGWSVAASEPWRAVEQPELKQLLEEAPVLPTESLGEPARGVQPWEHWSVPNPDGKSWDVLQWYLEYGWGSKNYLSSILAQVG